MATQSGILAWRTPWTRGAWLVTVHGVAQSYDGAHTHVFVLELAICLGTLVHVSM